MKRRLKIDDVLLYFRHVIDISVGISLVILLAGLIACTDADKPQVLPVKLPHVIELRAIPKSLSISDKYFYPKPFTIRAKYSNKKEKNISSRMTWVSEDTSLLTINAQGELKKTGGCFQKTCVVSLIATDSEPGKSLRLVVNISKTNLPVKKQKAQSQPITQSQTAKKYASLEPEMEEDVPAFEDAVNFIDEDINEVDFDKLVFSSGIKSPETLKGGLTLRQNQKDTSVTISELRFENAVMTLVSGELYQPNIIAIDSNGEAHRDHGLTYECISDNQYSASIMIDSGCVIIGVEPGEIDVKLKVSNFNLPNLKTQRLHIQVNPVAIQSSSEGFKFPVSFVKHNFQTWFNVKGLDSFGFYRATLSGSVTPGYRLSIFNRAVAQYQTCLNTLPLNANSVSCYFETGADDVTLVIENPMHQFSEAQITIERTNESLFQYKRVMSESTPLKLSLDLPVPAFIFANEAGGNNRHYYVFENGFQSENGFQIILYYLDAPVKMNAKWDGGFCNESMMKQIGNGVSCQLPRHVTGRVFIDIDGNNGEFGMFNGPAAIKGGSKYQLLISNSE